MRSFASRLRLGQDLRDALEDETRGRGIAAGCVLTCVGSLSRVRLRRADGDEDLELAGPLEIVALVGTLSSDGPHLHMAVADGEGRVLTGHVPPGCSVHTTAEIVLAEPEGLAFGRAHDADTSWRELVVRDER